MNAGVEIVIGTRPEAIKLAPVAHELRRRGSITRLLFTGQHRDMVRDLLGPLCLDSFPSTDLGVMSEGQQLNSLAARLFNGIGERFHDSPPWLVVVQGDTTSAMCAAIAAFHDEIPVAHVEAGLRSGCIENPFPEEFNREVISKIARWHFCPTEQAARNLRREGVKPEHIEVTGNTVIDSLLTVRKAKLGESAFARRAGGKCKVLVTMHRRENHGKPMRELAGVLADLSTRLDLEIVLPLHPSPVVQDSILPALVRSSRVHVCEPLNYADFVATLADADIVVTDSGGVQEEAPALGTVALVVRDTTERPEVLEAGCALLVGTSPRSLERHLEEMARSATLRASMANRGSPFGDGKAAKRIVRRLLLDDPRIRPIAVASA